MSSPDFRAGIRYAHLRAGARMAQAMATLAADLLVVLLAAGNATSAAAEKDDLYRFRVDLGAMENAALSIARRLTTMADRKGSATDD